MSESARAPIEPILFTARLQHEEVTETLNSKVPYSRFVKTLFSFNASPSATAPLSPILFLYRLQYVKVQLGH